MWTHPPTVCRVTSLSQRARQPPESSCLPTWSRTLPHSDFASHDISSAEWSPPSRESYAGLARRIFGFPSRIAHWTMTGPQPSRRGRRSRRGNSASPGEPSSISVGRSPSPRDGGSPFRRVGRACTGREREGVLGASSRWEAEALSGEPSRNVGWHGANGRAPKGPQRCTPPAQPGADASAGVKGLGQGQGRSFSVASCVSGRSRTMAAPIDAFRHRETRGHDHAASRARGSKMAAGAGATGSLFRGRLQNLRAVG